MSDMDECMHIEKLIRAIGNAWGHAGLAGPPRVVALVRGNDGAWRLASTEEDALDVLGVVVDDLRARGGDAGPAIDVTAPYTSKDRAQ